VLQPTTGHPELNPQDSPTGTFCCGTYVAVGFLIRKLQHLVALAPGVRKLALGYAFVS
jgi:hypothetical protein